MTFMTPLVSPVIMLLPFIIRGKRPTLTFSPFWAASFSISPTVAISGDV